MLSDEIKEELNNVDCDECSLRKACDMVEVLTLETICWLVSVTAEEKEDEN